MANVVNIANSAVSRVLPPEVTRVFGDLRGRVDGDVLALGEGTTGDLLSLEEGGLLRRWERGTARQLSEGEISDLDASWQFSPDGRLLAGAGVGIQLWDLEALVCVARCVDTSWVLALAFDLNATRLATGHEDHVVRLWSTADGRLQRELIGHQDEVCALAFSPDGAYLASAGEDRSVRLWSLASGKIVCELTGHTDRIDALAWSVDGKHLASAAWDTSVRIWDVATGELVMMLNGQGECVHSVLFHPDDRRLICGDSDGLVRIWERATLKVLKAVPAHFGSVQRLSLTRDGRYVLSGGVDRVVRLFDLQTGVVTPDPSAGPRTAVIDLAMHPSSTPATPSSFLALHQDGGVYLNELNTGKQTTWLEEGHRITALATAPQGFVCTGNRAGEIEVWAQETMGGAHKAQRRWAGHGNAARHLVLHRNGHTLASSVGVDGAIKIWDARAGELTFVIPLAVGPCAVESIDFHPTLPLLASAGVNWTSEGEEEGSTTIWDVAAKQLHRALPGAASKVQFHPAGKVVGVVSLSDAVLIWDFEAGAVLEELSLHGAAAEALAFSRDLLAVVGDDGAIRFWEAATWKPLATWDLETRMHMLRFDPTGRWLLSGNENSTCYLMDVSGLSPTT